MRAQRGSSPGISAAPEREQLGQAGVLNATPPVPHINPLLAASPW